MSIIEDIVAIGKFFNDLFIPSIAKCLSINQIGNSNETVRYYEVKFNEKSLENETTDYFNYLEKFKKIMTLFSKNDILCKLINVENLCNDLINVPSLPQESFRHTIEQQIFNALHIEWFNFLATSNRPKSKIKSVSDFLGLKNIIYTCIDNIYLTLGACTTNQIEYQGETINDSSLETLTKYLESRGDKMFNIVERIELARKYIDILNFLIVHCHLIIRDFDMSNFYVDNNKLYLLNYECLVKYHLHPINLKITLNTDNNNNNNSDSIKDSINHNNSRNHYSYMNTSRLLERMKLEKKFIYPKDLNEMTSEEMHSLTQQIIKEYRHDDSSDVASTSSSKSKMIKIVSQKTAAHNHRKQTNKHNRNTLGKNMKLMRKFDNLIHPYRIYTEMLISNNSENFLNDIFTFTVDSVQIFLQILFPLRPSLFLKRNKKYTLGACPIVNNKTTSSATKKSCKGNQCHFNDLQFNLVDCEEQQIEKLFPFASLHTQICQDLWNEQRLLTLIERKHLIDPVEVRSHFQYILEKFSLILNEISV